MSSVMLRPLENVKNTNGNHEARNVPIWVKPAANSGRCWVIPTVDPFGVFMALKKGGMPA
jgi:hypothetical protein